MHTDAWNALFQFLAYAYYTQTYTTTIIFSINLALTRKPLEASELLRPYDISAPAKKSILSKELQNAFFDQVGLMQTRAVATRLKAQKRYKTAFDKQVKRVPAFVKDGFLYLTKQTATTKTKANDTSWNYKSKTLFNFKSGKPAENHHNQKKYDIFDTVGIVMILLTHCKDKTFLLSPVRSAAKVSYCSVVELCRRTEWGRQSLVRTVLE